MIANSVGKTIRYEKNWGVLENLFRFSSFRKKLKKL